MDVLNVAFLIWNEVIILLFGRHKFKSGHHVNLCFHPASFQLFSYFYVQRTVKVANFLGYCKQRQPDIFFFCNYLEGGNMHFFRNLKDLIR